MEERTEGMRNFIVAVGKVVKSDEISESAKIDKIKKMYSMAENARK